MRKVPSKNYLYLVFIVMGVVILTIGLSRFYNNRHRETSILYNYLSKVTLDDLDTYLMENEISIIYIDDKYNVEDNNEEQKLKDKIIEYNMNNQFVFLDSQNIDAAFIESFNKKYNYNFKEEYPMVIVINRDKVISTYTRLDVSKINFEELK